MHLAGTFYLCLKMQLTFSSLGVNPDEILRCRTISSSTFISVSHTSGNFHIYIPQEFVYFVLCSISFSACIVLCLQELRMDYDFTLGTLQLEMRSKLMSSSVLMFHLLPLLRHSLKISWLAGQYCFVVKNYAEPVKDNAPWDPQRTNSLKLLNIKTEKSKQFLCETVLIVILGQHFLLHLSNVVLQFNRKGEGKY